MKKILITGNSGYIGSHLSQFLSSHYEVYGLDKNDLVVPVKEFYKLDINKKFVMPVEFDCVVHLAALVNVGESERNSINYYITNVNGTMNVLANIKTKNFIFASTGAAEYCQSAYGVSKRSAEYVVREYCTRHANIPYTIFRFYNVIGSDGISPTNPDGLFYKLIEATKTGEFTIFGYDYEESPDGTCIRDYIHVWDLADAHFRAIQWNNYGRAAVFNLGTNKGISNQEIVDYVNIKYGPVNVLIGERRPGDPDQLIADASLARRELAWQPKYSTIDQIVDSAYRWYTREL